jgi:hypothetical protein
MSMALCDGQTDESWREVDYGGPVDHPLEVFPASALGRSIIDRFEAIVRRFGARLAIQDTAVSLTYAELGGWAIGLLQ